MVVVLTGSVAAGKSTVASGLRERYGVTHLRTQDLLRERANVEGAGPLNDRRSLQHYGEELDLRTKGRWVADDLAPRIAVLPADAIVVIDSLRRREQIDALRTAFGRRVLHVHLTAPVPVLSERYKRRQSKFAELSEYSLVQADPTEAQVGKLELDADVVIDTVRNRREDVLIRCAARMGLIAQSDEPRVDVLIGGEFGSEGKGNIAFYLAPEYDVLVRVGGPNAGHVVPTSPPYTHRSLPSGTLAHEGAQLVIGPGAVINPGVLLQEIADCGVEGGRLVIDPQCGIIDDQAIQDEEALVTEIGSTAQGVGVGMARRILERGAYAKHGGATRHLLARDVPELAPYTSRTAREVLSDAFSIGARVLLEGTQGTGLSLYHGYYPSVTSRDTSVSGCLSEAGISPRRVRKIIMVCRTYPIRVGGPSGFLSQEITWGDVAERSGQDADELRAAERGSVSGRERRVSEFDWKLLHEAAELNGATDIALTFADHLSAINSRARRFDQLTAETRRFIEEVEHVAGCPVTLVSCRFDQRSVLDRRSWRGHVFSPRLDGEV